MDKFLKYVGVGVLGVASVLFQLWVFTKVWAIIAVPMGAQQIGMWQAWGLSILMGYFAVPSLAMKADKNGEEGIAKIISAIITTVWGSLICWTFAYLFFT